MSQTIAFEAVTVNTIRRWTLAGLWAAAIAAYFVLPLLMLTYRLDKANFSQWTWAADLRVSFAVYIGLLVLSVAAHEGLHALGFLVFTRHAQIGFKLWTRTGPVCYATAAEQRLTRFQYIVTCLTPQLLSIACLALVAVVTLPAALWCWLLIIGTGNLAGGVFDIYAVTRLLRLPKRAMIEDVKDGWKVYLPA